MSEEQIVISEKEERRLEIERAFNPDRCKVIRKELFAGLRDPAVMIRDGNITFNTACMPFGWGLVSRVISVFSSSIHYLLL